MRPKTRLALVSTESTAPTTSMRRGTPVSRDSETNTSTPRTMRIPSGTLMPNAHRQEK
jgi:hypothetical protein